MSKESSRSGLLFFGFAQSIHVFLPTTSIRIRMERYQSQSRMRLVITNAWLVK